MEGQREAENVSNMPVTETDEQHEQKQQSIFSDYDLYLFGQGRDYRLYEKMGAHPRVENGVAGVHFAVWAPNALAVSVIGSFNDWNRSANPMHLRHRELGVWETFVPGAPIVPINYGSGPAVFTLNLRLSKTFGLGPKLEQRAAGGAPPGGMHGGHHGSGLGPRGLTGGGGGPFIFNGETDRKYNLTFSVAARNLFNNVNYAPPVGTLGSPLFGTSNALAGPPFSSGSAVRRIDMQMLFSF